MLAGRGSAEKMRISSEKASQECYRFGFGERTGKVAVTPAWEPVMKVEIAGDEGIAY